jgi:predicted  nucleic acid-binding Zn-ribbon protein
MTQAEALFHLQEIDLQLIQAQKRLNEIAATLADNKLVLEAQSQVEIAQKTLTPLQTRARNLELEIQSATEKIRLTDQQLYSGKVRNPKELQEMQQEIQSLKNRTSELEDVLLETMLSVENAETILSEKQAELQQLTSQSDSDHHHLIEEQKKLHGDIKSLRLKREGVLPPITPESLKSYDTLRPRKNNQPIALLVNGSCSVCRVEQDMAVISEVRKGQKLIPCASCGRLMVYKSG